jgi:hypothetical protein
MKVVKRKTFINANDETINEFLSKISAEDVVSTHFGIYGYEGSTDEWTTIFYKEA